MSSVCPCHCSMGIVTDDVLFTVYPERLIVYHAGTASEFTYHHNSVHDNHLTHLTETTLLACLKVTTLFIFGFFDMIMAPAYLAAGESLEKTAAGKSLASPPSISS